MVTLLAHADERRVPTGAVIGDSDELDTVAAAAAAAAPADAAHQAADAPASLPPPSTSTPSNRATDVATSPPSRLAVDRPPSPPPTSALGLANHPPTPRPHFQSSPSSTTSTSSLGLSSSSSASSSPTSSSCDTTCIHVVDGKFAAEPKTSTKSQKGAGGGSSKTSNKTSSHTTPATPLSTPVGAVTAAIGPTPIGRHQRHHSTTGVIGAAVDRHQSLYATNPPLTGPKASAAAIASSASFSAVAGRTRSDDDCDYESVVLRVKPDGPAAPGGPGAAAAKPTGSSSSSRRGTMERSLRNGGASSDGGGSRSSATDGRPDIEQIRAFLESEYVPGADGCWTSVSPSALHQRDSFIHRSYNKKLLARKNAIDEMPSRAARPASMPVRRTTEATGQSSSAASVTEAAAVTKSAASSGASGGSSSSEPVPVLPAATIKRDSFLRNSLNSIRRSFSIRSSSSKKSKAAASEQGAEGDGDTEAAGKRQKGGNRRKRSAGKSVSGTDEPTATQFGGSMDGSLGSGGGGGRGGGGGNNNSWIHGDGYALSDGGHGGHELRLLNVPLENVRHFGHSRNSSTSSCTSQRSTSSNLQAGARPASMAPLQSPHHHSGSNNNHNNNNNTTGGSDSSATAAAATQAPSTRSPNHQQAHQSSVKIDSKSIKHLQTSPGSASGASSPAARSPSPQPVKSGKDADKKEKKRKELSSGRQKKFHRHFQQVAADEHVINYFSCALVSDILLQGHLYITDNYFAFYSNVFGFVTKLLIPTVSVVKISKEKTAKIIPNAVGVATADERHVFGSFMSREAAYRLMLSVWLPVAPVPDAEAAALALPGGSGAETTSASVPGSPSIRLPVGGSAARVGLVAGAAGGVIGAAVVDQLEVSEEFSMETDSSSAISGNESPAVLAAAGGNVSGAFASASGVESLTSLDGSCGVRNRNLVVGIDLVDSSGSPPHSKSFIGANLCAGATSSPFSPPPTPNGAKQTGGDSGRSRSPAPQMVSLQRFYEIELPPRLMYAGYVITFLLLLLTVYLVWRIWSVHQLPATGSLGGAGGGDFRTPNINWDADQNIDVYAEVLKWQRQMQSKGADEAQIILNSNLEQIARVRKSLETLSILIHDKSAANLASDEGALGSGAAAAADSDSSSL